MSVKKNENKKGNKSTKNINSTRNNETVIDVLSLTNRWLRDEINAQSHNTRIQQLKRTQLQWSAWMFWCFVSSASKSNKEIIVLSFTARMLDGISCYCVVGKIKITMEKKKSGDEVDRMVFSQK